MTVNLRDDCARSGIGAGHADARCGGLVIGTDRVQCERRTVGIGIVERQVEGLGGAVGHAFLAQRAEADRKGGRGSPDRHARDQSAPVHCWHVTVERTV